MIASDEKAVKRKALLLFILPLLLIISALCVLFFGGMFRGAGPMVSRTYPVMGTMAELRLYGPSDKAEKAADAVQDVFTEIENRCSVFKKDSEVSRLNETAFRTPFKCSEELWDLISISRTAWQMSGGTSFDVTAKPLMELWGFYRKSGKLPSKEDVDETLKRVGLEKVKFDDSEKTVKFTVPGMGFDFGGIAKGYAVDAAVKAAKGMGIKRGVINLGGNMHCFPIPPPGKDYYTVGIKNPLDKNEICEKVDILASSVATSGNYERYVTIDGKQYTHIMDVKKGVPVSGMLSVTVITPLAVYSDLLSTSIFINGEKFAREICAKIPGTSVLIIKNGDDGRPEFIRIGRIWLNH